MRHYAAGRLHHRRRRCARRLSHRAFPQGPYGLEAANVRGTPNARARHGHDRSTTTPFPQGNEGYIGFTIYPLGGRSGISDQIDDALAAVTPNIILLTIGTNDIDLNLDVANAPKRLGMSLEKLTGLAPNALIVLARITPLNYDDGNARVRAYNEPIPPVVQSRTAAGKHIVLVDIYHPFTANGDFKTALLADQWHPNAAGYLLRSQVWYDAIQPYLH